MRIALGGICQESHSFSPAPGTMDRFRAGYLLRGQEILDRLGGVSHEVAGAMEAAAGHELVPLIYASASSSGQPLRRGAYGALKGELLDRLQASLPVDAVLQAMHGAMVAEHCDDATGDILESVRDTVGSDVPVVATLDLHANVTRTMARAADALVGYHTAPHVDQADAGRRGMALLLDTAAGKVRPAIALRQIPMVVPAENGQTTEGPFCEVMAQVVALEREPGILAASAYAVQPWLDLPEMGCSVVVVSDGDAARGSREAERLARELWRRREAFRPHLVPVEQAIDRALSDGRRPYVFADSADAPSSGAPGDSTVLLKALLERGFPDTALLNIVDPSAVAACVDAGIGNTLDLSVGAALSSAFCGPVTMSGRVRALFDGTFRFGGPAYRGVEFRMGRTAVVAHGPIHIVVMEQPVIQWDPELYRCVGLEPAEAKIVAVKSPAAFRAAYGPLAAEILILDAPGACSPNLGSFPWKRVSRPMFPFDDTGDELPMPVIPH